jgi:hypothetical protein
LIDITGLRAGAPQPKKIVTTTNTKIFFAVYPFVLASALASGAGNALTDKNFCQHQG